MLRIFRWTGAGVIALGVYGFVATLQPDAHFGRILTAYGGVFVGGSLAWGVVADGYRPDRFDINAHRISQVIDPAKASACPIAATASPPPIPRQGIRRVVHGPG